MDHIMVITPHPDDETLGCGGTILKHKKNGDKATWLIVTKMGDSFSQLQKEKRTAEINRVRDMYQFDSVIQLGFEAGNLDSLPLNSMIDAMGKSIAGEQPTILYLPNRSDIHSDHKVVFDAAAACTKWFRYPSVKKVLVYETLSETDFIINPDANFFRPNVFADISMFLEKKLEIMRVYESELGEHPFPRSEKAIESLAYLRGSAAGCNAAEAFMLLKERI